MTESNAPTVSWQAGTPLTIGGLMLLPIERTTRQVAKGRAGVWLAVTKEAHAIVLNDGGTLRAVGADAMPVSLAQLRASVPGLDAVLATI